MNFNTIRYSDSRDLPIESILTLYRANEWSSAQKPDLLHKALMSSHSLVTAWDESKLVGLGNAISDGFLVVYYPHMLVLPDYQGCGIGTELMRRLMSRYEGFHQHMLVADGRAIDFYRKCGFERAGRIGADKAKTRSRRVVPVSDNLAAWLAPYRQATGPIWPHGEDYLAELQAEAAKEAGVKWLHNALRHSFVSYRLAQTQNVNQTALEAGNSPAIIFEHYRELVTPDEAKAWFAIVPELPTNVVPATINGPGTTAVEA